MERTAGELRVTPLLVDGAPAVRVQDRAGTVTWAARATIGVDPLQQYLLDAGRGRLVVAPLAWDLEGARWFDPAPEGAVADPADPLYWAGLAGNWNHQCAECHTTGFVKGYDPVNDTYTTTATHPAVGCAACHGAPTAPLDLRSADAQLRACAPCHSRRETQTCGAGPADPLLDHYRPALLDSGAFAADGRITSPVEPFEWGSWTRSKMARAGVRCTDCHDPHTSRLRRDGDEVCATCHATRPFASPDHPTTGGCVGCHMPEATYMGLHRRHDHGFPRPGAPGPAAAVGPALAGDPAAVPALRALALDPGAPAFDRASALALLRRFPAPPDHAALRPLADDPEALLRLEAVATLAAWGDIAAARRGLTDPARAVRLAALRGYVEAGGNAAAAPELPRVLAEAEAIGACQDDLPSTWQNLGRLRAAVGDREGAIGAFETLLRLDPGNPTALRALEALGARSP